MTILFFKVAIWSSRAGYAAVVPPYTLSGICGMTAKGRSQAGAGGEGLPLGTACPQPDVGWLGNHVLRKGKSSYTSGLTSGNPLVPDFSFLTNKELKALHFTPIPALHSPHELFPLQTPARQT